MGAGVELWGWNGATFELLEVYPGGILQVGRGPIGSTVVRMVGVGLVVAGPHDLYWVACNPAAGNSIWEITDSLVALAPIVMDCFSTVRQGHVMTFDPPIEFATGIFLETFAFQTSVILCYV